MISIANKKLVKKEIKRAIAKAPRGNTLNEISKSLGIKYDAFIYRFKQHPDLRQLFDSLHSTESIVYEAITGARENATAIEIARKLGMTRQNFHEYRKNHPELGALFRALHCNDKKKMQESTLEKLTNAIIDAPKEISLYDLQKEYGLSNVHAHLRDFPELKALYIKHHGEYKRGRMRNFDNYIKISNAIKNAHQGSCLAYIARSMNMSPGLLECYTRRAPCLTLLYNVVHKKPAASAF